jgi:hypothetical protein
MKNSTASEAFRQEVCEFLAANLSEDLRRRVLGGYELSKDDLIAWQKILYKRGWAAPHWPKEYGGEEWNIGQSYAFEEECIRWGAPILSPIALGQCAAILIHAGTEPQKRRYLPRILDGSEMWAQGWSEPEAGSDLASLKTEARRVGDKYIVNGTKIWTTEAQWASQLCLLCRTDPAAPKRQGISILIVPMASAGLTFRPIPTLDGKQTFNQTYFENVEVPVENLIGPEHGGWSILKDNIGHERIMNGSPGNTKAFRRRLIELASRPDTNGRRMIDTRRFQEQLAAFDVRLRAYEAVTLSVLEDPNLTKRPEASLIKIRGTELQQDILRLASQISGYASLAYDRQALKSGWMEPQSEEDATATILPFTLFMRKASISSGTNEIQRDIIARHILGKPLDD